MNEMSFPLKKGDTSIFERMRDNSLELASCEEGGGTV